MKYHLITLGCQMNISDSERVITTLNNMGLERTEDEEEAQLLGIVACSVRQKAINKVYSRIHKWNKWKNSKSLITFVSGCILPADQEKFMKMFDMVFPMAQLPQFPEMIRQYGIVTQMGLHRPDQEQPEKNIIKQFWKIAPKYDSTFEAFIPIQNGCDKFCTFCAVPYTRGREISRPSEAIIDEISQLVLNGYKSITLLGQNVNSYGLDKLGKEITFPELLRRIGQLGMMLQKEFLVYFTSPHPRDMTPEVIDIISTYPILAKMIHLPLQSGDDKVLIHMNRKHRLDEYRSIIHYIRKTIPEATIFTDIITGFTGETEEQFRNTQKAMEEFQFNMAYIAQYSPRPGAVSSRWIDDVPYEVKKARFHMLSETLEKISYRYNITLVGKTMRVLVTGSDRKGEYLTGYTEGKIIVRLNKGDSSLIGTFTDVKITGASDFSVAGDPVLISMEATA